jgi:GDSL-like Lipase/Acylhydrolase family
MALKNTWQVNDQFQASDQNDVANAVNALATGGGSGGSGTGINTDVQTALDAKQATNQKGQPNGYAPLDGNKQVPAANLPSYVDDVLEFATLSAFPATGSLGTIYVDLSTNNTYRWSGSSYIAITSSPGTTDAVPEGSTNLYYTQTRADARANAAVTAERTATATLTGKTINAASNTVTGLGVSNLTATTGTKDNTTVLYGDGQFRTAATGGAGAGVVDAVDGSSITTSTALQTALDSAAALGKAVALKPGQTITFGTGATGVTVPAYGGLVCETNSEWKTGAPSTLRPKLVAQTGMTGAMVTVAGGARNVRLRGFDIDGNNVVGVTMGLYFSTAGVDVECSHAIEQVAVRRINGVGITGRIRTSVFHAVAVFECLTGVSMGTNGLWFDTAWTDGFIAHNKNVGIAMAADSTGNVSQYVQFTNVRVERTGQTPGDPKNAGASPNWNATAPGWNITGAAKCTWLSCTTDANNGPGVQIAVSAAGLGYRTTVLTFTGCIFNRDGQYSGTTTGNMPGVSVLGFSAAGPDRAGFIRFENCFVSRGGSADDNTSTYEGPYYGVQAEYCDFFVWHGSAAGAFAAFQGLTDMWQPEIIDQYGQKYQGGIADRANHTGNMPAANVSGLATVATTGNYSDLSGAPSATGGGGGGSLVPAIPNAADVEAIASTGTVTVVANSTATTIASGVEAANMVSNSGYFGLVGTTNANMATVSTYFKGPGWKDNYAGGGFGSVVTGNWAVDIWVGGSRYIEFTVGRTDYSAVTQYSYRVWVDGRKKTNLPVVTGLGSNGQPSTIKVDLGAATINPHRVKLEMSGLALMNAFVEPAGSIWAAKPTGPRLFVLGCSITQGPTAVAANTGFENGTWLHRFANLVGLQDVWNGGEAGTGPNTTSGSFANYKTRVTSQVIPANPDVVIVDPWFNDFGASRTKAQITADIQTIITTIKAGLPNTAIIVMGGVDPTGTTNMATMTDIDNATDGVEKVCVTNKVAFVSGVTGRIIGFDSATPLAVTTPWITPANKATYISSLDNLHPTDAGHEMIAYRMREAWSKIWDVGGDFGSAGSGGGTGYIPGGPDVSLMDGGTGTSLSDPNADRIMFWDDSAGAVTWLTAGTGLTITGTTLDAAGGGGGITNSSTDTLTNKTMNGSANTFSNISADSTIDGTTNKAFTNTERTKLTGIATAATANSADATLLARGNHTGTQTAATISDFSTAADGRISASTKVNGSVNGTATALTLWTGSQANFDAIGTKDGNTIYVIT